MLQERKERMKLFVSDLHLGDGTRADDFHRDDEFLKFLDFAAREAEELIIVGDLMDLWQSDLNRIIFEHTDVVSALIALRSEIRVTYIVGNHDYIPFARFAGKGVGIEIEYHDDQYGIYAEHGNRYDIFNRYKEPLESVKWPINKTLSGMVADLERYVYREVDVGIQTTLETLDKLHREALAMINKLPPSSEEYLRRGGHFGEFDQPVQDRIASGSRIVIFGHTHQAELRHYRGGIYGNCGSWAGVVDPTSGLTHLNPEQDGRIDRTVGE